MQNKARVMKNKILFGEDQQDLIIIVQAAEDSVPTVEQHIVQFA